MFLDIFIIVVVLLAILHGWSNGLIKELISFAGFLLGFIIACFCYSLFGKYLLVQGSSLNMILSIVAFFIIWIIVPILCGVLASTLTAGLKRIPLVGLVNNLGGVGVSLVKYTILMSLVINAMSSLGILNNDRINGSHLYTPITSITSSMTNSIADKMGAPQSAAIVTGSGSESSDTIWIDIKH